MADGKTGAEIRIIRLYESDPDASAEHGRKNTAGNRTYCLTGKVYLVVMARRPAADHLEGHLFSRETLFLLFQQGLPADEAFIKIDKTLQTGLQRCLTFIDIAAVERVAHLKAQHIPSA